MAWLLSVERVLRDETFRPIVAQQLNIPPSTAVTYDSQRVEIQPLLTVAQDRLIFPPSLMQCPNFPPSFVNNVAQVPFLAVSQSPNNFQAPRFPREVNPNFKFPCVSSVPQPVHRLPNCVQRPDIFYYPHNCPPQLPPASSAHSFGNEYGHLPKPPPAPTSWISPSASHSGPPFLARPLPPPPPPQPRLININNILNATVSQTRPQRIVVILRGLPGSGKTYAARAIKEKEFSISGRNPRILSIDDYFTVESEDEKNSSESRYEFNAELEKSYRTSLLKTFKKTVDDGLFPFIIVDSCSDKISYFDEYVAHALSRGFAVYVGTVNADVEQCKLRSHGRRKAEDIELMAKFWEKTPDNFLQVDVMPLVQPDINTVEMEDVDNEEHSRESDEGVNRKRKCDSDQSEDSASHDIGEKKSKWELMMDVTEEQIDRLDGLRPKRSKSSKESDSKLTSKEGAIFTDSGVTIFDNVKNEDLALKNPKKHVSWADVEQYKRSLKERHNQFDRLLSEINARSALEKVHLI